MAYQAHNISEPLIKLLIYQPGVVSKGKFLGIVSFYYQFKITLIFF